MNLQDSICYRKCLDFVNLLFSRLNNWILNLWKIILPRKGGGSLTLQYWAFPAHRARTAHALEKGESGWAFGRRTAVLPLRDGHLFVGSMNADSGVPLYSDADLWPPTFPFCLSWQEWEDSLPWESFRGLTHGNNGCFTGEIDQRTPRRSKGRPSSTEMTSALHRSSASPGREVRRSHPRGKADTSPDSQHRGAAPQPCRSLCGPGGATSPPGASLAAWVMSRGHPYPYLSQRAAEKIKWTNT